MHILIVNFRLDGMSEAEYLHLCDEIAPAFAEVPGLVSKAWLADGESNCYGGVYTFEDRAACQAYTASELFAGIGATPGLVDVSLSDFAVIEGPTRVTGGRLVSTG